MIGLGTTSEKSPSKARGRLGRAARVLLCLVAFGLWVRGAALADTTLNVTPTSGPAPLTVTATWVHDGALPPPACDCDWYRVDWGDGDATGLLLPGGGGPETHTYAAAGTYTVQLTCLGGSAETPACNPSQTVTVGGGGGAPFSFRVTAAPPSLAVVPGQRNPVSLVYRATASGGGRFTAVSREGRFVTSGGSLLDRVRSRVSLPVAGGTGTATESLRVPPGVIAAAREAGERILYERRFAHGGRTETTRVRLQVVPASAGPFSLVRVALRFAGQAGAEGRATVPRHARGLRAVAEITYNGGGLLRAQWKVDGQVVGFVSRYLYRGMRRVSIESPKVPGLPTYDTGRHEVELEILEPVPPFDEPVIFYYVTGEEAGGAARSLRLVSPPDGATLPLSAGPEDGAFRWETLEGDLTYTFELTPAEDGVSGVEAFDPPVVSALSETGRYVLTAYDREALSPGVPYRWHVEARDGKRLRAASPFRRVRFQRGEGALVGFRELVLEGELETPRVEEDADGRERFVLSRPQQLHIRADLENRGGEPRPPLLVEFRVGDQVVDSAFVPFLDAGAVRRLESDFPVEGAQTRVLAVRALDQAGGEEVARIGARVAVEPFPELIRTGTLQMSGLRPEPGMVRTGALEMTGLRPEPRVLQTGPLRMTGLALGPQVGGFQVIDGETLEEAGAPTGPSLELVHPNGGEVWRANTSEAVLWSSSGDLDRVRILLRRTGEAYGRVLVESASAFLGRVTAEIPSNVLSGTYTVVVESQDGSVQDESDGEITIQGISGFVYPDFDVRDLQRLIHPERITVQIQNNGLPWEGTLPVRVHVWDPDSSHQETLRVEIPMDLGSGEPQWFDLINPFAWDAPWDRPRLRFLVEADPDQEVAEGDEGNNLLEKEIRCPCGLRIDALSHDAIHRGPYAPALHLYGFFGSEPLSKRVCFLEADDLTERICRTATDWDEHTVEVPVGTMPEGTYRVVIYCTNPEQGEAYPSNLSSEFRIKPREQGSGWSGPSPDESDIDAMEIIWALNEEYGDALQYRPLRIDRLWTEETQEGLEAHMSVKGGFAELEQVFFEVWSDKTRVHYVSFEPSAPEADDFFLPTAGGETARIRYPLWDLEPGAYTLVGRIRDSGSQEDEASHGFLVGP